MKLQYWLDRLRYELQKRDLPASYSTRFIEELRDHFTDIQMENRSMEAQPSVDKVLGTPEILATVAETEFVGRTFSGRHPILAFVLWPVPTALLMLIVTTLIVTIPSEWLVDLSKVKSIAPSETHSTTIVEWIVAYSNAYLLRFAPFAFAAWFFIRKSRQVKRLDWGLAACACVACFAFMFRVIVEPPTLRHELCLRFGLGFEAGLNQWQNGLIQMIIPILIGFWACRKQEHWFNYCKKPLLVTLLGASLLTLICSAPLRPDIAKLANLTVFAILILSAIIGSGVGYVGERFGMRLR